MRLHSQHLLDHSTPFDLDRRMPDSAKVLLRCLRGSTGEIRVPSADRQLLVNAVGFAVKFLADLIYIRTLVFFLLFLCILRLVGCDFHCLELSLQQYSCDCWKLVTIEKVGCRPSASGHQEAAIPLTFSPFLLHITRRIFMIQNT